jgi:hypothetical protein
LPDSGGTCYLLCGALDYSSVCLRNRGFRPGHEVLTLAAASPRTFPIVGTATRLMICSLHSSTSPGERVGKTSGHLERCCGRVGPKRLGESQAAWAGRRLPDEWEWQYATQGYEWPLYPWGDDWGPSVVSAADKGRTMRGSLTAHRKGASLSGGDESCGATYGNGPMSSSTNTRATLMMPRDRSAGLDLRCVQDVQ